MSDWGWPPKLHRDCACDECRNFAALRTTYGNELIRARRALGYAAMVYTRVSDKLDEMDAIERGVMGVSGDEKAQ